MLQIDWMEMGKNALYGLGGFVLAIIAKPLDKQVNDWLKRRDLRQALYAEIAYNYCSIDPCLFTGPPECLPILMQKFDENIKRVARLETFESAKSQSELVFKIREWSQLISLYSFLADIVNSKRPPEFKARQGVTWLGMVEACVVDAFASGPSLEIGIFREVSRGTYKLLSDVKSGKRQRASDRFKEVEQKFQETILKRQQGA